MKRSQNPLAARHRGSSSGGPERIHACRSLRDSGEKRDLRPAQIVDRFIEITARRVSDPANPIPVGNDAQVVREDRFSSVPEGEDQSSGGSAASRGLCFTTISLHHSLTDVDLLCSVPMMKTHGLATVTLGMKNMMGAFQETVYGCVRGQVHDVTSTPEPSGTAAAIVDVVRANKLGLVVIDGSTAMEGQGPSVSSGGQLVKMDVIIAGTNPLATDMVAADLIGFVPNEVPTFAWAQKAGMIPGSSATSRSARRKR